MCSSEEVAEGVVKQVDEGGCVQISIAHHLRGKQGLSGAAAEKATHHAIAHVHVMCHFLKRQEGEEKTLVSLRIMSEKKIFSKDYYPDPRRYSIFIRGVGVVVH